MPRFFLYGFSGGLLIGGGPFEVFLSANGLFHRRLFIAFAFGFEGGAAFGDFGFFCLNLFALQGEIIFSQRALFGVQLAQFLSGAGDFGIVSGDAFLEFRFFVTGKQAGGEAQGEGGDESFHDVKWASNLAGHSLLSNPFGGGEIGAIKKPAGSVVRRVTQPVQFPNAPPYGNEQLYRRELP